MLIAALVAAASASAIPSDFTLHLLCVGTAYDYDQTTSTGEFETSDGKSASGSMNSWKWIAKPIEYRIDIENGKLSRTNRSGSVLKYKKSTATVETISATTRYGLTITARLTIDRLTGKLVETSVGPPTVATYDLAPPPPTTPKF